MEIEMIIEIAAGIGGVTLVLWVLYEYIRNKGDTQTTADALIADAKVVVQRIEAFAASEGKRVEDYLSQKAQVEASIASIQADIQKAKDFADKVKAIV